LLAIDGVVEVEAANEGLLRIRFNEGQSPAEAIVHAAVSNGWGLRQINPDQTSLEDVFVQLTYQEA
jgi:ABC-2 type transport system ATP-binding protein